MLYGEAWFRVGHVVFEALGDFLGKTHWPLKTPVSN